MFYQRCPDTADGGNTMLGSTAVWGRQSSEGAAANAQPFQMLGIGRWRSPPLENQRHSPEK